MTNKEVQDRLILRYKAINNWIDGYQQYLNVLKGFFGKDFPMITKFESLLNKFQYESKNQLDEIAKTFQELNKQ